MGSELISADQVLRVTMMTPYRAKGSAEMSGTGDSALNWYSRRLSLELIRAGVLVTVLGPRRKGEKPETWDDQGLSVLPTFDRCSPLAVLHAFYRLVRIPSPVVHVQHELFAFGGIVSAFVMPLMLLLLRAMGRRIVTTIHGVIPLSEVSDQFVRDNRIPGNAAVARILWRLLIRSVAQSSNVVHVHEQFLRETLVSDYAISPKNVSVIPLGVESHVFKPPRERARREIGLPHDAEVALFFGYLAAYKGIEYLLEELPALLKCRPHLHVLIAGAVPSRLAGHLRPEQSMGNLGDNATRVHFLGFIPDSETARIFASSDVLLLPYRVAMSSSGPLALSAGFGIPVLMSEAFRNLFPDMRHFFELKAGSLTESVCKFFDDSHTRVECEKFIADVRNERAWPKVASRLAAIYEKLS